MNLKYFPSIIHHVIPSQLEYSPIGVEPKHKGGHYGVMFLCSHLMVQLVKNMSYS